MDSSLFGPLALPNGKRKKSHRKFMWLYLFIYSGNSAQITIKKN